MEKILSTDSNKTVTTLNTIITNKKLEAEVTPIEQDSTGSKITTNNFLKLTQTINMLEEKFSENCCQSTVNPNCCQSCQTTYNCTCQNSQCSNCNCNNTSYSH